MKKQIKDKKVSMKTYSLILLMMIIIVIVLSIPIILRSIIQPAGKFTGIPSVIETNGTDHSLRLINVVPGDYKYYIRCEDRNSNINSEDFIASFKISESSIQSSTSSGSGSNSGEIIKPLQSLSSNINDVIFKNFPSETGIKEIIIEPEKQTDNSSVNLIRLKNLPEYVKELPNNKIVYSYLIIESSLTPKNAKINFQLSSEWINKNYIDKEKISLFRFISTSKEWVELKANKISEDKNIVLYTANTPGFSVFAITGEITPQSISNPIEENPAVNAINETNKETESKKPEEARPAQTDFVMPIIVIIITIASIAIYLVKFKIYKKKTHKKRL